MADINATLPEQLIGNILHEEERHESNHFRLARELTRPASAPPVLHISNSDNHEIFNQPSMMGPDPEAFRATPEYIAYYYSLRPHDPRLPTPIVGWEYGTHAAYHAPHCMFLVRVASSSTSLSSSTTSSTSSSPVPLNTTQQPPLQPSQSKILSRSLVDKIQQDFPDTPSPIIIKKPGSVPSGSNTPTESPNKNGRSKNNDSADHNDHAEDNNSASSNSSNAPAGFSGSSSNPLSSSASGALQGRNSFPSQTGVPAQHIMPHPNNHFQSHQSQLHHMSGQQGHIQVQHPHMLHHPHHPSTLSHGHAQVHGAPHPGMLVQSSVGGGTGSGAIMPTPMYYPEDVSLNSRMASLSLDQRKPRGSPFDPFPVMMGNPSSGMQGTVSAPLSSSGSNLGASSNPSLSSKEMGGLDDSSKLYANGVGGNYYGFPTGPSLRHFYPSSHHVIGNNAGSNSGGLQSGGSTGAGSLASNQGVSSSLNSSFSSNAYPVVHHMVKRGQVENPLAMAPVPAQTSTASARNMIPDYFSSAVYANSMSSSPPSEPELPPPQHFGREVGSSGHVISLLFLYFCRTSGKAMAPILQVQLVLIAELLTTHLRTIDMAF
jgi:hypothetical protein